MKRLVLLTSIVLASFAGTAVASTIGIDATARGAYATTGVFATIPSGTPNGNYLTGQIIGADSDIRSFFVYDLSSVTGTITSASISFALSPSSACGSATCGYISGDPSETLSMFDFSGSLANLILGTGGVAAWTDLGSGAVFGTRVFTAADSGIVTFVLNASAVSALNAAGTGFIAFGGHLTTIAGSGNQAVFGASQNLLARLNLETLTTVPEPASMLLLGAGLAGAARYLRKRRG